MLFCDKNIGNSFNMLLPMLLLLWIIWIISAQAVTWEPFAEAFTSTSATFRWGRRISENQHGNQWFTKSERCGMEYKSWRICREPQNGPCNPKTEIYEWMRICQIINKPVQMTIIDHLFASSLVPWPMAHMSHHGHENHAHDQISWSDGTFPRFWSGGRPQAVV